MNDPEIDEALELTRDDLIAKLKKGRRADLARERPAPISRTAVEAPVEKQ